MNRDDAIKAVQVDAATKWAPRMDGLTAWEAGVVVDAVEPIIRADERAKRPSIFDVVQSTCGHRWVGSADEGVACPVCEDAGVMTRRTVAALRDRVEGLPFGSLLSPHAPACPGRPGYRGICNCERLPRQYLWRSDVLALLPALVLALLPDEVDRG